MIIIAENKQGYISFEQYYQKLDLIDIYRTSDLTAAEYTLFSNAYGIFSKVDHILGHKTSLNKFKSIQVILNMFSDHNGIKLGIRNRKVSVKFPKYLETK